MEPTRLLALLAITTAASLLSCTGADSPVRDRSVGSALIGVDAVFSVQPTPAELAVIDRIRLTAMRFDNRAVLEVVVLDVDPSDNEWLIDLEVTPPLDDPRIVVLIELISSAGDRRGDRRAD